MAAHNINVTRGEPYSIVLLNNLPSHPDKLVRRLRTGREDLELVLRFANPRNLATGSITDKPFLRQFALQLARAEDNIQPYDHR